MQTDPTTPDYPYERLRLACGCHEVQTRQGAAKSYECGDPNHREGKALSLARTAIAAHRVVTVKHGALDKRA